MMDQQPATDQQASVAGWYLYGVVLAEAMGRLRREDLGELSLVPVRHRAVCALGSDAPLGSAREGLTRHADVVQRVFERLTVLPARYGVVLPAEQVVETLLRPHHDQLVAQLRRLEDMAQVTVTGVHREQQALARLLRRDPALAARRHQASQSYDAAIRLGQYVAAGLERMREEDARTTLEALRHHAVQEREADASHEHMFLRASFLVPASAIRAFDEAVGELRRRLPHAVIRAVGPQPPYAFVELETDGEPAWA